MTTFVETEAPMSPDDLRCPKCDSTHVRVGITVVGGGAVETVIQTAACQRCRYLWRLR